MVHSKDFSSVLALGQTRAYADLAHQQADRQTSDPLLIDCANGVGAPAAKTLNEFLGESLTLELKNTSIESTEKLNKDCGADYVKVNQKLPPSLASELRSGQRGCSLDGDADRLIYYYLDDGGKFRMLDGDKITTLVASFIMRLVRDAGLEDIQEKIKVGVVQTAYANGNSTTYLSEVRAPCGGLPMLIPMQRLPVTCVPTGVKHLHHAAAEKYDIGVYFEANGHGTVLFSTSAQRKIAFHKPSTAAQATALGRLKDVIDVINQTVGDALSDMLLVEVALYRMSYSAETWDKLYSDLPNRLVKVKVGDRNAFVTEDAERRLVRPFGLQAKIDELVQKTGGRSFVRPSGTEDVVRVYAEARETDAANGKRPALCTHLTMNLVVQTLPSVSLDLYTMKRVETLRRDLRTLGDIERQNVVVYFVRWECPHM